MKTKLRFRLDVAGENDGGETIYSREIEGQIAKTQLRHGPSRAGVRRALASNDPKVAVTTLIGVLNEAASDPQVGEVRSAALHLGSMGPAATEAIPALHALMKLDHFGAAAAYAAYQIEGLTPEQMKILLAELNDRGKDSWAFEAARFLGEIGPQAAEATPALAEALMRKDLSSDVAQNCLPRRRKP